MTRAWIMLLGMSLIAQSAQANVRKAKRHFKRAEQHYSLGRFEEALAEYSAAYEAKELPGFLFNIAQCHMELKHYERAIFFYEGYLREKPESRNQALVEERLAEARKEMARIEEEKRLADEKAHQTEKQRQTEEQERLALEKKRLEQERIAAERAEAARRKEAQMKAAELELRKKEQEPFYKTLWFWSVVGSVAAVAGGTAIIVATGGDTKTVLPERDLQTIDVRP